VSQKDWATDFRGWRIDPDQPAFSQLRLADENSYLSQESKM
jgi:hypothetical protein